MNRNSFFNCLVLSMILLILIIPLIMASDVKYDNRIIPSEDLKTITYVDTAIFGSDTELATIELKTNIKEKVGVGYVKVFEYKIKNIYEDVDKMLGSMNFYNVKDGMKPVEVDVDFKYSEIINHKGTDRVCNIDNKTLEEICEDIPYNYNETVYYDYTPKTIIKGEEITISGWTTTKQGDRIEWEQYFYDDKLFVDKSIWAEWTADLNTDILVYYKFEESSGAIIDSTPNGYNATATGVDYQASGKIDYALDYNPDDFVEVDNEEAMRLSGGDYSISFWFKADSTADSRVIWKSYSTAGLVDYDLYFSSNKLNWRDSSDTVIANAVSSTGTWYHVVLVRDLVAETTTMYINGTPQTDVGSSTTTTVTGNENSKMQLGRYYFNSGGGAYFNGIIDELGIWNRSLTADEITQLYNGGDGISYTNVFGPTITLNYPTPDEEINTINVTFNCSSVYATGLTNVSFYLDGVLNETNSSGINDTNYIFEKNVSNAAHNWTCGSCATNDLCELQSYRDFEILLNISGYIQNSTSFLADQSIFIVNQSDNSMVGNCTSDALGYWTFGPLATGTYIVTGYDPANATQDGDTAPHIVVP